MVSLKRQLPETPHSPCDPSNTVLQSQAALPASSPRFPSLPIISTKRERERGKKQTCEQRHLMFVVGLVCVFIWVWMTPSVERMRCFHALIGLFSWEGGREMGEREPEKDLDRLNINTNACLSAGGNQTVFGQVESLLPLVNWKQIQYPNLFFPIVVLLFC